MSDWNSSKLIKSVLGLSILLYVLVGASTLGVDLPVIRPLVGFVFLTLVPGALMVRCLGLGRLDPVRTLVYSVGASIAIVMFTGLLIDRTLPFLGITRPLSVWPVLCASTLVTLVLCLCAALRERAYRDNPAHKVTLSVSPFLLLLLLPPLLTAFGVELVNSGGTNAVLLVSLALVAGVGILAAFNRLPVRLYSLAVVSISLSLMLHFSLISHSLVGADPHVEYYFANLTLSNGGWDPTIAHTYSSTLSVTVLLPMYSLVTGLDPIWVIKVIYPLLFSLVPLALYQLWREQAGNRVAFFAAFFFVSFSGYFYLADVPRQQISELFYALSLLVLLGQRTPIGGRIVLLILFGLSVVVSHYSTSYVFVFQLLSATLLVLTLTKLRMGPLRAKKPLRADFEVPASQDHRRSQGSHAANDLTYAALIAIFAVCWYMFVSSGKSFNDAAHLGQQVLIGMRDDMFNLNAREGIILLALGKRTQFVVVSTPARTALLYLQYLTQVLIMAGLWVHLMRRSDKRILPMFAALSVSALVMLALSIVLPYVASTIHTARFYHLALFALAPYCILGGISIQRSLTKAFRRVFNGRALRLGLRPLACAVLVPYFLASVGFIAAIEGDDNVSRALTPASSDYGLITYSDEIARQWLMSRTPIHGTFYGDRFGYLFIAQIVGPVAARELQYDPTSTIEESYIFLRSWNVARGERKVLYKVGANEIEESRKSQDDPQFVKLLSEKSTIYTAGTTQICR